MACLDMYNSDHKSLHRRAPATSPRISFSSDFVDIQQSLKYQEQRSAAPPVSSSSDFEFSVSNYNMMTADELFFEGRLLPYKDSNRTATTLREELLVEEEEGEDEDDNDASQRPTSRGRWKGFLGLKKSHNNASKKGCRNDGSSSSRDVSSGKRPFGWSSSSSSTRANSSHQVQNEGSGTSCKDVEIDF
ncbi:uncharacterized protein LOC101205218 [Cucumis sativus]|uniref:Uncharacterized protein n=1 Tax=Cucumis sativus TaxID=3659 RepID=A0A0A0LJI9_CUCSA|nr:uncharacterized protein LOC101205218 [Cucumis sativus]KGN62010.1 hypothetical protein Csa_006289 [Cucumis sativus]